jgi:hypothetical protein
MKRCPKCNLEYFDNMLEFCLEDGSKLLTVSNYDEAPTVTKSGPANPSTEKTLNLPYSKPPATLQFEAVNQANNPPVEKTKAAPELLKDKVTDQTFRVLETAPIVVSLAHNWWQWIYLNNQYYPSLTAFLLSADFLMWLLLLIIGAALSLFALKYARNKGFAYTSLVILAINLLLFLVPRR